MLPLARIAELPERLRLDLADALTRQVEALADLLERVVRRLADAEAHADHLLLARREAAERVRDLLAKRLRLDVQIGTVALRLDEVADRAVGVAVHGRVEAHGLAHEAHQLL